MDRTVEVGLRVNGERATRRIEARMNLVDFLREELGLTGSHVGCEHGVCGACTVRVDGRIVRGCLMLAVQAEGADVWTVEGLSDTGEIRDLQEAFVARNALQCGYCTPGMLLTLAELRERNPAASRQEIREYISGNYCRCTGYEGDRRCVRDGARARRRFVMTDLIADRWLLDRPNSYIGRSVPRPNAPRLAEGRGAFVDDIETGGRAGHAAFVRSPHAHARIRSIDAEAARAAPGVIAVVTGPQLAEIHDPWVGVLTHLEGLKSAPQYALPLETATWQGEAVVAVVADSRARAEDAAELVRIDWEVLPAVTQAETALDPGTPVIHESLGDNLAWRRNVDFGDIEAAYGEADHIVEETYVFARHTGVCVEPRAILADWNPGEGQLTVWHNNQCPHMVQNILATHFRLDEHRVRVIARDVGGSFGIKVHTYADEIATVGLSILLRRPVKFVADRLESFLSDIHARDQRVLGKVAVNDDGTILGFEIDALSGIGPYSMYPRTSGIESNQIVKPDGWPLCVRPLPGAGDRRLPEQEHDVPVSRGRAPGEMRGDRGARGCGGACDRASIRPRFGAETCARTTPIPAARRRGYRSRTSRTRRAWRSSWRRWTTTR